MKKNITNKDVEELLKQAVKQISVEYRKNFHVSWAMMSIAEELLSKTFSEEQKKLYEDFCEKRKIFYHEASKIYKDKYQKI